MVKGLESDFRSEVSNRRFLLSHWFGWDRFFP